MNTAPLKLVILDKDGTLVKPASGGEFVQHPEDQELLPGVAERVAELQKLGAILIIASNQGGGAAGYKTLESAAQEMAFVMQLLPIQTAYFCPDKPDGATHSECWEVRRDCIVPILVARHTHGYRKPNPGMLNHARLNRGIFPENCIMIGDRPEDEQAAQSAGISFQWADQWRRDGICQSLNP